MKQHKMLLRRVAVRLVSRKVVMAMGVSREVAAQQRQEVFVLWAALQRMLRWQLLRGWGAVVVWLRREAACDAAEAYVMGGAVWRMLHRQLLRGWQKQEACVVWAAVQMRE